MMHACAQAPYNLCLKPSCNMSLCALRTQTGRCNCKSPRWTIRAMLDASASAASRAALNKGQTVALRFGPGGDVLPRKINQIHQFKGLERVEVERAQAGDIVLV